MVSDSIRAVSQVKSSTAISKYESTYLAQIEDLIAFGSDRDVFEQRIRDIITVLNGDRHKHYYIASYPFFNSRNSVVYNLLHCTSSIEGFKLYKSTAWSTLVTGHPERSQQRLFQISWHSILTPEPVSQLRQRPLMKAATMFRTL